MSDWDGEVEKTEGRREAVGDGELGTEEREKRLYVCLSNITVKITTKRQTELPGRSYLIESGEVGDPNQYAILPSTGSAAYA